MSALSQRLSAVGYSAGWRMVRRIPPAVANVAFSVAADGAFRRDGKGVRQLRRNLARVVPQAGPVELDELTRRAMRSYARYWRETFQLPSLDQHAICTKIDATISGVENIDAALQSGNGVVVALPHSGNWDIAGLWLAQRYGSFTTVAERLKPESLYQRFVKYRESLGFEIISADDIGAFRILLQRLRDNKIVCLVGDRDMSSSGVPVNFFGEQIKMPSGAARLAASTGAALLPVGSWFTDNGWGLRIHPRVRVNAREEIHAATQALADIFAGDIAVHPEDWHMLQKIWLTDFAAVETSESETARS